MAKEEDEIQQQQGEPEPPAPERIVIDPNADPDDDGDDDAPVAARPDGKPGRRNGYRALKESAKAEKERADRLERDVAELRGRLSAPQAPIIVRGDSAPQVDPAEARIGDIESQQDATLQAIRGATDPAQVEKLTKHWRTLDRQRLGAISQVAQRDWSRQQQAAAPDLDQKIGQQTLRTNYPKLFNANGPTAYGIEAQAEAMRIQEQGRHVGRSDLDVATEAAATVYARHGLGAQKKPAPTDTDRARYTAQPTRPAASGKEGWSPNKQQLIHAMAYTEHRTGLTDSQRVAIWYNEVGKKHGIV